MKCIKCIKKVQDYFIVIFKELSLTFAANRS